jgi:D-amino-acid dehydrogenase
LTTSPEVLVIGGGIVGSATAYHLARRGASVTLLEAADLAYGATGRNLGYIWVHTRRPGPELELVMHLRGELEELPGVFDDDFGLRTEGGLVYVHTPEQLTTLREFVERRQADGVDIRLIDGDEARSLAPILPDTVIGASFCPLDAQMDSTRYVRGFANAAARAGARILEHAPVRSLERKGSRIARVVTDDETFTPGRVVVAAGAWTPRLLRPLRVSVPIEAGKGYSIDLAPAPALPEPVRRPLYLHETRVTITPLEGMIRLAGTMELSGLNHDVRQERVAAIARSAAWAIRGWPERTPTSGPGVRVWNGPRPMTPDGLPVIGRVPGYRNLIVASGHAMLGVTLAPATGEAVAELITTGHEPDVIAPFDPARFG